MKFSCLPLSSSSGGKSSIFRVEGPAGPGCLGLLPAVPAQRGNAALTAAGEGRRRRARLGQGKKEETTFLCFKTRVRAVYLYIFTYISH